MRFVLDNDIDAALCAFLVRERHECWTAAQAGLAEADDDDLSVYADDRGAVLITHDAEFTSRRVANPFGQHVRLKCSNVDALEVFEERFDEIVNVLGELEVVVLQVTKNRARIRYPVWRSGS